MSSAAGISSSGAPGRPAARAPAAAARAARTAGCAALGSAGAHSALVDPGLGHELRRRIRARPRGRLRRWWALPRAGRRVAGRSGARCAVGGGPRGEGVSRVGCARVFFVFPRAYAWDEGGGGVAGVCRSGWRHGSGPVAPVKTLPPALVRPSETPVLVSPGPCGHGWRRRWARWMRSTSLRGGRAHRRGRARAASSSTARERCRAAAQPRRIGPGMSALDARGWTCREGRISDERHARHLLQRKPVRAAGARAGPGWARRWRRSMRRPRLPRAWLAQPGWRCAGRSSVGGARRGGPGSKSLESPSAPPSPLVRLPSRERLERGAREAEGRSRAALQPFPAGKPSAALRSNSGRHARARCRFDSHPLTPTKTLASGLSPCLI